MTKADDSVLARAAAALAATAEPASLRAYLTSHYDWVVARKAEWGGHGRTWRLFWATLAEELEKAGVLGQHGAMSGAIVQKVWERIEVRQSTLGRLSRSGRSAAVETDRQDKTPTIDVAHTFERTRKL